MTISHAPALYGQASSEEEPRQTPLVSETADSLQPRHSPRGALVRSLVLPGWGQLYNRQWYKLPFVYGALAGTSFLAARNTALHRDARHAFFFAAGMDQDPNPYAEYEDDYLAFDGASAQRLFEHKNALRRNRDLSYFSVGVVYLLSVLDAYVNAHLFDFDTGPDLTLRLSPEGGGTALRMALSW